MVRKPSSNSKKEDSPAAYGDVQFVMDMAVKKPGLIYECKSPGAAIHFKQRCNKYRNLLRQMAQEQVINIPGYRAETSYDCLVIAQTDAAGLPSRQGVRLVFRHHDPVGKLFDPQTGEEIQIEGLRSIISD